MKTLFLVLYFALSVLFVISTPMETKFLPLVPIVIMVLAKKNAIERIKTRTVGLTWKSEVWNIGTLLLSVVVSAFAGIALSLQWRLVVAVVFVGLVCFGIGVGMLEERMEKKVGHNSADHFSGC